MEDIRGFSGQITTLSNSPSDQNFGSALGVNIRSDYPVPELNPPLIDRPLVTVSQNAVRMPFYGEVIYQECGANGCPVTLLRRDDNYFQFDFAAGQRFRISHDGLSITDFSRPSVEPALRRATFLGLVLSLASGLTGACPLHASAVVRNDHALMFLGPRGIGKSTIAAALQSEGFEPWTDDTCALFPVAGAWRVPPGPRKFRLWPDSAEALGMDYSPLYSGTWKVGSEWKPATRHALPAIGAIFHLQPEIVDKPRFELLSGTAAVMALFAESRIKSCLRGTELSRHLNDVAQIAGSIPIYRASIRVGLERMAESTAAIAQEAKMLRYRNLNAFCGTSVDHSSNL